MNNIKLNTYSQYVESNVIIRYNEHHLYKSMGARVREKKKFLSQYFCLDTMDYPYNFFQNFGRSKMDFINIAYIVASLHLYHRNMFGQ